MIKNLFLDFKNDILIKDIDVSKWAYLTVNAYTSWQPILQACTLFMYEIHAWKRVVRYLSVYGILF